MPHRVDATSLLQSNTSGPPRQVESRARIRTKTRRSRATSRARRHGSFRALSQRLATPLQGHSIPTRQAEPERECSVRFLVTSRADSPWIRYLPSHRDKRSHMSAAPRRQAEPRQPFIRETDPPPPHPMRATFHAWQLRSDCACRTNTIGSLATSEANNGQSRRSTRYRDKATSHRNHAPDPARATSTAIAFPTAATSRAD